MDMSSVKITIRFLSTQSLNSWNWSPNGTSTTCRKMIWLRDWWTAGKFWRSISISILSIRSHLRILCMMKKYHQEIGKKRSIFIWYTRMRTAHRYFLIIFLRATQKSTHFICKSNMDWTNLLRLKQSFIIILIRLSQSFLPFSNRASLVKRWNMY